MEAKYGLKMMNELQSKKQTRLLTLETRSRRLKAGFFGRLKQNFWAIVWPRRVGVWASSGLLARFRQNGELTNCNGATFIAWKFEFFQRKQTSWEQLTTSEGHLRGQRNRHKARVKKCQKVADVLAGWLTSRVFLREQITVVA